MLPLPVAEKGSTLFRLPARRKWHSAISREPNDG